MLYALLLCCMSCCYAVILVRLVVHAHCIEYNYVTHVTTISSSFEHLTLFVTYS